MLRLSNTFLTWLYTKRLNLNASGCLLCLIQGAGATTLLWLPAYGFFLILLQTVALFSLVSIIQFCHKTE